MTSVQIILENYNTVYYPGQTITGRVECNFHTNFLVVRIKFKGEAETEWHENETYYDDNTKDQKTRTIRYHANEIYFDTEYILVQGGDSYRPGKHSYPFSYVLPNQLPSTFEGSRGHIRYFIKATIDRPWKFDYEDQISLNIISPLDLNYLPELRKPINCSVDKTMCPFWCRHLGALTFNMSVPARGFVPGQEVSIEAHVDNRTNVGADYVIFKIVQDTEFIVHYPATKRKYDQVKITACRDGGVGAQGDKSWTSCLRIPPGVYPNVKGCSIISVHYFLKAKVVVPCLYTDFTIDEKITIGTIPLSGMTTTFP